MRMGGISRGLPFSRPRSAVSTTIQMGGHTVVQTGGVLQHFLTSNTGWGVLHSAQSHTQDSRVILKC